MPVNGWYDLDDQHIKEAALNLTCRDVPSVPLAYIRSRVTEAMEKGRVLPEQGNLVLKHLNLISARPVPKPIR